MLSHPLYPLLRQDDPRFSLCDQVDFLVQAGLPLLQLRLKTGSDQEKYDLGLPVSKLCKQRGILLIVNDRPDLALALDADGVHLGQEDLPPEQVRMMMGRQAIIGWSSHNRPQMQAAQDNGLDYLALGPMFSTRTKSNPDPVVPDDLRQNAPTETTLPLVAIGGITPPRSRDLCQQGYKAVAVCGALWDEENPATAIHLFCQALKTT